MELKIKDICELLQVSEKTVYTWIKENKIPAYRINHQFRFNKAEINDWIIKNRINASEKVMELNISTNPLYLTDLLKLGGIFHNIKGNTPKEVLTDAINTMHFSDEIDKDDVLESLLEREELMPTAIGHGIALPHPRNPIIDDIEYESLAICLLEKDIDYHAMDGTPVHTLFIILSSTPRRHLEALSKISYICQQQEFIDLLKNKQPGEQIFSFISEKENEIRKRSVDE